MDPCNWFVCRSPSATLTLSGYWFLDDDNGPVNKQWEPPANVVQFIEKAHANDKKVVYM
jgi:sterol 3beta-glucosyltransferase